MTQPVAAASYVVHTDRPAIHRRHRTILVVHWVLALAFAALMVGILIVGIQLGTPLQLASLPFLILLLGQMFQLTVHSYNYGTRVAISEPMLMNSSGITINSQSGRMEVPWEAVTAAEPSRAGFSSAVRIRLHPEAAPDGPGIRTDISPRLWRILLRRGVLIGSVGIRETPAEILQAIAHFSNGRTRVG